MEGTRQAFTPGHMRECGRVGWGGVHFGVGLTCFEGISVQIPVEDQLESAEVMMLEDRIFSAECADFVHSGAGDRPVGTQSWH